MELPRLEYRLRLVNLYPRICCNWIYDQDFTRLERAFWENHEQHRQEYLMIEEEEKPPVSGIEQLIEAVMDGLAPSSQSLWSNIACKYVKDRKEAEKHENREGEVTPLMESSLRKVIRSRIREESTAIVWYNLMCNIRQNISKVAESEIDNHFVQKDTSYEHLLQLVDRLYLLERDGTKLCKSDAYLMYQVIEQNLDPSKFSNHQTVTVLNNKEFCRIELGTIVPPPRGRQPRNALAQSSSAQNKDNNVYVMEAEHKSGIDYCRQTGKRFTNLLLKLHVPLIQVVFEPNPEISVEDEIEQFMYALDITPTSYPLQLDREDAEHVVIYAHCSPSIRGPKLVCQTLKIIDQPRVLYCPAVRKFYVR